MGVGRRWPVGSQSINHVRWLGGVQYALRCGAGDYYGDAGLRSSLVESALTAYTLYLAVN